jgi:formylglycine-generating enzyme required for sulfatase activity
MARLVRPIVILAALTVFITAGLAGAWWVFTADDREDEEHYRRDETFVSIANLSGRAIFLYRAGANLRDSAVVPLPRQHEVWLPRGNYFVRMDGDLGGCYYPVPLTGYRSGPEREGGFPVTIRPEPEHQPPVPDDSLPPFGYVPSGTFLIGDRSNPRERHHVWLSMYFMATLEVANGEFRDFLASPDGYANDANWTQDGRQWKRQTPTQSTAAIPPSHPDYSRFGQSDQPVTRVNWFEANAYCAWVTKKKGGGMWRFALPNDAEWEKAARGPDNLDFALNMTISDAEVPLYNWKKNLGAPETVIGRRETLRRFTRNRYGLFHMTGNVAEWTQSVLRPFSRETPFTDDDRNHDETPGQRTVRGGSWYSASNAYLSTPYRDAFPPAHSTQDIGFRLVARRVP